MSVTPPWPPEQPTDFPDGSEDSALPAMLPRTQSRADVVRLLAQRFPAYGSPNVRPVEFADTYARLMATAVARAEWLGHLLSDAVARYGEGALVGEVFQLTKTGEAIPVSEEVRALVKLEADERTRAEKLARDGIRIGIEASQVDTMRSYGRTVITSLKHFTEELGLPWTDPVIARLARRALHGARMELGFDVRPPDEAGPPLSDEERARLFRSALD